MQEKLVVKKKERKKYIHILRAEAKPKPFTRPLQLKEWQSGKRAWWSGKLV